MFSVVACLFWAGAEIIIFYKGEINSLDVFRAIFILFLSSFSAGMAAGTGPDMGRASAAVDNVFGILDYPSSIDAV